MKYTYDFYDKMGNRYSTGLSLPFIFPDKTSYIEVTNNLNNKKANVISSQDDIDAWLETIQREFTWSDAEKKKEWDIHEGTVREGQPTSMEKPAVGYTMVGATAGYSKVQTVSNELPKDHINPSHYQGYIQDMQWLEAMQYLPHFRNPKHFEAAVELQIRKYLDRSGGKDCEIQENKKCLWYMKFLVAYMVAGKPIRVKDIPSILGETNG